MHYAMQRGLPGHALPTRADKLGRGAAGNAVLAVRKQLQASWGDSVGVQTCSAESKQGVDELRAVAARWLEM